jgi:hypothetical protein
MEKIELKHSLIESTDSLAKDAVVSKEVNS